MEILRGVRWLADLEIVAGRKLQEAFDACARMLRSLPLVTMRQQENNSGEQSPLVFAGANELINHRLRNINEVTKLRLPQHQCLGVVAAVAIFETQDTRLG